MKKILLFLFLLICSPLYAGEYLGEFQIGDTVYFSAAFNDTTGTQYESTASVAGRLYRGGTYVAAPAWAELDDANLVGVWQTNQDTTGYTAGQYTMVVWGTIDSSKIPQKTLTFNLYVATGKQVDIESLGGAAQSLIDFKDFADAGYDPTNNVVTGVADGALTAAKFGADAITAAKIAADVHAECADAVWDEVLTGASHNVATSAGRRLRALASQAIRLETAQAGTATTITLDASASATDEMYRGALIVIAEGTGIGQTRRIVSYNGTSKVATINGTWLINPDATSVFQILAVFDIEHTGHGIAQAGAAGTITLASSGSSVVDDYYNDQRIHIVTNTGADQVRLIDDYNGTTKVASITPNWATNPDNTSVYHIDFGARVDIALINGTAQTANDNGADINAILQDTGTTLDTLIKDIPTVAEFNARSIVSANYVVVGDTIAGVTSAGLSTAAIDAIWDEAQSGHVGVGTFGIIASEIADILVDTAVIGALGAGLTNIPWNSSWDTEAQSECADALTAYDPPTKGEMDTAHALLATPAEVNTEVDNALDTAIPATPTDKSINSQIQRLGR